MSSSKAFRWTRLALVLLAVAVLLGCPTRRPIPEGTPYHIAETAEDLPGALIYLYTDAFPDREIVSVMTVYQSRVPVEYRIIGRTQSHYYRTTCSGVGYVSYVDQEVYPEQRELSFGKLDETIPQ